MRGALEKMATDPACLSEAQIRNPDMDTASGGGIAAMIKKLYAILPDLVNRARDDISGKK